jgi:hypothetical protein
MSTITWSSTVRPRTVARGCAKTLTPPAAATMRTASSTSSSTLSTQ